MTNRIILLTFLKSCDDAETVRRVFMALGGENVKLNAAEQTLCKMIESEYASMDDRMESRKKHKRAHKHTVIAVSTPLPAPTPPQPSTLNSQPQPPPPPPPSTLNPQPPTLNPPPHPDAPEVIAYHEQKTRTRPITDEKMREYARQKGIPDDYLAVFVEQMETQNWAYVNSGGNLVKLRENNFKTVIGSFWNREKKARKNGTNGTGSGFRRSADRNAPYVESGLEQIFS